MFFLPLKYRRVLHVILFIMIIAFQVGLFYFWRIQNANKARLSEAIENLNRPNRVMEYSNKATSYYFEADNYFAKYLQTYNPKMLEEYKASLKNMSITLDTLGQITTNDSEFSELVQTKVDISQEMANIKKQLDHLINNGFSSIKTYNEIPKIQDTKFKAHNTSKALNSIKIDTIRSVVQEPKKKGLFGRIGKAIAGKSEVKKEQTEIRVSMNVGNRATSGSIEEQLKRLSGDINKYYAESIKKIQHNYQSQLKETYGKLQSKDKAIVQLNENILNNSKNIINFYASTADDFDQERQKKFVLQYNQDLDKQNFVIKNLLIGMGIATLILLIYTLIANGYEKKLLIAKKEAEQNDELKTRILGMLSHEMRAPLNIISNKTLQLKENLNSIETLQTVDSILFNSNSLNLTVNQILEFIKNENSQLKFYNVNLILKDEVESITNSLKTLAETKKIDLVSNADESTKQLVWADSVKIHQLFYNLIGNAIKFTQHGTITVDSKLDKLENKFKYIVSITDTGAGIPGEDLPNIFNKYFQSKTRKAGNKLGAGLGLSLCKEIVELYGGEIAITSELGKGSVVSFYMFFDFPHLSADSPKEELLNSVENTAKKKVAIVDDDIFIRKVIRKQLEEINFEVHEFDASQKMINFLNEEMVDLIITDIQLPEISGLDLAQSIRGLKNKNAQIPIIAVTGDHTMNYSEARKYNINEYLIKPINQEEFYQKIINVLNP